MLSAPDVSPCSTHPRCKPLKRGNLTAAGFYDVTTETVHGYRALAMVGLPSLVLFFLFASGGGLSVMTLVLLVAAGVAGWQLPAVLIKSRGAARLDDMDRHLPELIDLLIATVEAGMGFGGSIGMIAHRFTGGLGDELRLTLKQQSLGISTSRRSTTWSSDVTRLPFERSSGPLTGASPSVSQSARSCVSSPSTCVDAAVKPRTRRCRRRR